jgi:hypothetical protein
MMKAKAAEHEEHLTHVSSVTKQTMGFICGLFLLYLI